jgi:hypothetical protein
LPTPWPYPLSSTPEGEQFTTEAGEQYVVYFAPADGYFPGLAVAPYAFMLGFLRQGEAGDDALDATPPHDPRIRATIVQVVEQFFEDERRLLVYVCRAGRREKLRHRLFASWFRQYNDGRLGRRVVGEEHGLSAAFLYRKDSPFAWELENNLPSMEEKLSQY